MGWTSEQVAKAFNVSRQKQDEFALISHTRAAKVCRIRNAKSRSLIYGVLFSRCSQAVESGIFTEEIIPIEVRGAVISVDDTVRPGVTMESLAKLKPVFAEDGSTTAGNASGVGDGAALCFLTTRERAEREGWDVIGKYVASAFVGMSLVGFLRLGQSHVDGHRRGATIHGHLPCVCNPEGSRQDRLVKGGYRHLGGEKCLEKK